MFDLRVKTTATFSFKKLQRELNRILPETVNDINQSVAAKWRQNILNGEFLPLKPATMKRRKYKNYNTFYPHKKPINTTKPLLATGELYKSIRATKDGVKFNHYGDWHVKGNVRPKRNWQTLKGLGTAGRVMTDEKLKNFRKQLRIAFKTPRRGIRDIRL